MTNSKLLYLIVKQFNDKYYIKEEIGVCSVVVIMKTIKAIYRLVAIFRKRVVFITNRKISNNTSAKLNSS